MTLRDSWAMDGADAALERGWGEPWPPISGCGHVVDQHPLLVRDRVPARALVEGVLQLVELGGHVVAGGVRAHSAVPLEHRDPWSRSSSSRHMAASGR